MALRTLLISFLISIKIVHANDNYFVEYIGIERGLSNNAVTCIFQDHHGFMWFGTYDGLNRYDGYSFKVFHNIIGDANSLGDNHIYSIEKDETNESLHPVNLFNHVGELVARTKKNRGPMRKEVPIFRNK